MYNSTIADMLSNAGSTSSIINLCEGSNPVPLGRASLGYSYQFLTIEIPEGYAIEYIQYNGKHSFYGCPDNIDYQFDCNGYNQWYSSYYDFWNYSEGPDPRSENELYGGWENISVDLSLRIDTDTGWCFDSNGNSYDYNGCLYDYGYYSVWPSSEYEFTLYYRFIPVIPVE